MPLLKRGLGSPLFAGVGAVVVATTGRKSGQQREVPLSAARFGDALIVSTVRNNSEWLRNLEAHPHVTVWLHGTGRSATATVTRIPGLGVSLLRLSPLDTVGAPVTVGLRRGSARGR